MIRKWILTLLSLLLMLMVPMSGMAAAQHTLTIIPGDEIAAVPAIADFLNVFSITLTPGEKSGALTLSLDGTDIATIALGADATAAYVQSDLLSDNVLHVTWDDAFALMKNGIESAMAAEAADETQIAAVLNQMDLAKEELVNTMSSGLTLSASVSTQEEAMAQAAVLFGDDPAMIQYIEDVYKKLIVEDGAFADEARDTADQKYSLTLTQEDMKTVLDSPYVQQVLREGLMQENPELPEAELEEMIAAQMDEARKVFDNSQMKMDVTVFTLDGGETLVGMEMNMQMTVEEEGTSETAIMKMDYDRLTTAEGVSYKADVRMLDDSTEMMQMLLDFHRGVDEVSEGIVAMLVDGEELLLKYHAENPAPDVREREAALYLRSGASAIVEPVPSDRPIIAFRVVSSPADPAVLAEMEKADISTSVDVMKLSEEEMNALLSDASSRLMQAGFTAMGKLPTSTLKWIMGEAGMGE